MSQRLSISKQVMIFTIELTKNILILPIGQDLSFPNLPDNISLKAMGYIYAVYISLTFIIHIHKKLPDVQVDCGIPLFATELLSHHEK